MAVEYRGSVCSWFSNVTTKSSRFGRAGSTQRFIWSGRGGDSSNCWKSKNIKAGG